MLDTTTIDLRRPVPSGLSRPIAGNSGRIGVRRGWLALAGLLVTGAVLVLSASQTALLLPASFRPIPSGLNGAFARSGIDLGLGGLIVALGLMFASYAVAVGATRELSAGAVLMCIAALLGLVLLAPPLLSTDVFSYMAYGRMGALYGHNPYLHGPTLIASDPSFALIGSKWVTTPTAYGPVFTALSYVMAPLGVVASVLAYKAIAALSVLVIVILMWKVARRRGLDPVRAVALVGLNPVILIYGVGGGHNDLLMVAVLLGAIYVLHLDRPAASGALVVVAIAVKLTASVLLPFVLAARGPRQLGARTRRGVLTGLAVAGTTAAGLSFVIFGAGPLHLMATLHGVQAHGGLNSFRGLLVTVFGLQKFGNAIELALDSAFVLGVAWLVRRVWLGRLDWITAAGWATAGMLVCAGLLLPWYVAWLVPLAALSSDRRLLVTSNVMTGLCLTTL